MLSTFSMCQLHVLCHLHPCTPLLLVAGGVGALLCGGGERRWGESQAESHPERLFLPPLSPHPVGGGKLE